MSTCRSCRFYGPGHNFIVFSEGLKRRCPRCGREDWVFTNPYPGIGEPKHDWKMLIPPGELKR